MASKAIATVVKMLETLPEDSQDQVVEHLRDYLGEVKDNTRWDNTFKKTQSQLIATARRAKKEIAEGRAKPINGMNPRAEPWTPRKNPTPQQSCEESFRLKYGHLRNISIRLTQKKVERTMSENAPAILFAVRHGETEWNLVGKQQGHLDSPLTASGLQQARALAEGLADRGIDILYSSDLGRAMQTARIIAERLGLPVNADSRLRERHLGIMQGMTKLEFRDTYPQEWTAFESGDPDYVLPDGESANQRHERCVACGIELTGRHRGRRILIVAHGGVLNSFFNHALCIPLTEPQRFSVFNAAINCFNVSKERWRLDTWGDIAHLKGMTVLDDN
jgi:2,3-bisphosphoglycerate-dependent phosphoglycerate mutase